MKKNIGKIAVIVTAALVFTACASNSENIDSLDEEAAATTTKPVTTTSYAAEITTVEVEENTAATTATSSTTTTPSATTATQASTTTTTAATTPAPVVTTTTTVTTTKPVETTAPAPAVHTCTWETVYIESEPKWCQDIHLVWDSGFDWDLARKLYPNLDDPYEVMKDNFAKITGYPSSAAATGSATIKVEVWGTETYKYSECPICHERYQTNDKPVAINPIGTWQYVNGVNPRNGGIAFNTLWYDPYNIPQDVIDTMIRLWDEW